MKEIPDGERPKCGRVAALLIGNAPAFLIFKSQVEAFSGRLFDVSRALLTHFLTYLHSQSRIGRIDENTGKAPKKGGPLIVFDDESVFWLLSFY
jgi:hypothetical protein